MSRQNRILSLLIFLGVTLLFWAMTPHDSLAQHKYLIRAGYTNPVAHPITETGYIFQDLVQYRSKGLIKVEVYPSAQLGSNKELAESVRAGTIQMTSIAPDYMAPLVPWFDVLSLPFLWNNYPGEWAAFNGWLGKRMAAALEEKGVMLLAMNDSGLTHIANRVRPIEKAEDLKGLKIRVIPSTILVTAFQAMGAKPIAMDYKEVYTSMESGAIDGVLLGTTYLWNAKFHEVTKYFSLCNLYHVPMGVFMNKKFFDSLPSDLKEVVLQSAKIAQDRQRAKNVGEEAEILDLLREKTKVKINAIPADQLNKLREAVAPAWDFAKKKYGQELIEKLQEASAK